MDDSKITITDIARIAGVSKSTISRVLTKSSPVSAGLEKRVLEVIEEHQYFPNVSARNLSMRRTGVIGVLLNLNPNYHFTDHVSTETLRGLTAQAAELGTRLFIINGNLSNIFPQLKAERSVDGLIVMGLRAREEALKTFGKDYFPIVLLNYSENYRDFPSVSFAHQHNAYFLGRYVIERGHRRIGFIECSPNLLYVMNRRSGYKKAMHEVGLEINPDWMLMYKKMDEVVAGMAAADAFLALENKPTVMIASSDNLAISFMGRISAAGMNVPADVSVVGVDNIPISRYVHPSLTTEALDGYLRGKIACEMIHKLISGEKIDNKHILIPTTIIERQSLSRLN